MTITRETLQQTAALPAGLAAAVSEGLQSAAPDIERLYELGKRHQWNSSELPWASLRLGELPSFVRAGLADALVQTHYGELAALTTSAKLVQWSPQLADRLFIATQVVDEARHVEWFTRLLHELDAPATVMPELAAFIDGVVRSDEPLSLMVGMNLLIEGLAQTLLSEAGRVLATFEASELTSLRIVGSWLSDRIGRDESRHLAFGIRCVRREVEALDAASRSRLVERIARWNSQLIELTRARCDGLTAFGIDGDALLARCLSDARLRLEHAGLGDAS